MIVLVVVAHPDDEVLMCGGTIAKHVAAGDPVFVLIMADGVKSRAGWTHQDLNDRIAAGDQASRILGHNGDIVGMPDQRLDTIDHLVMNRRIEQEIGKHKPSVVYTHWHGDMNSDHQLVSRSTKVACRPGSGVREIYMGEVPSSTEYAGGFNPTMFVDIAEQLDKKIEALLCYQKEMREDNHARSLGAIEALAQLRGACVGVAAAEAFEAHRVVR